MQVDIVCCCVEVSFSQSQLVHERRHTDLQQVNCQLLLITTLPQSKQTHHLPLTIPGSTQQSVNNQVPRQEVSQKKLHYTHLLSFKKTLPRMGFQTRLSAVRCALCNGSMHDNTWQRDTAPMYCGSDRHVQLKTLQKHFQPRKVNMELKRAAN
jgi:hypothetical protein